jgi:hypothetical protein
VDHDAVLQSLNGSLWGGKLPLAHVARLWLKTIFLDMMAEAVDDD